MSTHSDFLDLFRQCETDLRAFIGAVVRDAHGREDVFQEVSRTLWEKFEDYDLDRPFGAWARGIAARKILEARRLRARFPLVFPPESVAAILDAFDQSDDLTQLHAAALRLCLDELPPRSREILTFRYDRGFPCARIARETGCSLKAIHQVLCRLRKALSACIERRIARDELELVPPDNEPAIPAEYE
jgi:RNA polymerase sigma-70 factor, ECF subfamily